MSLATSTAQQRQTLVETANMLAKYSNKFTEDWSLNTADAALLAKYQAYIDALQAALTAIAGE